MKIFKTYFRMIKQSNKCILRNLNNKKIKHNFFLTVNNYKKFNNKKNQNLINYSFLISLNSQKQQFLRN